MSLRYSLVPPSQEQVRADSLSFPWAPEIEQIKMITKWLSLPLQTILLRATEVPFFAIEEIRLRAGQSLLLQGQNREYFLDEQGRVVVPAKAYQVRQEDLIETLERMTQSSLYAAEEQLKQGFLTLPGGHRVGITGEAVYKNGTLQTLKHISGLNFRIAREIHGKARTVLPYLVRGDGLFYHTLILSPPRAGKTTLLRDLIRCLSDGVPEIALKGQTVGVVDERSELAGMWQATPTYNLGCRTDILDRCAKAQGMNMLIRSMSPQIIAVDELGHPQDVAAIMDALRSGVRVLSTAHAAGWEEARERPVLKEIFACGVFERIVTLSRRKGPGTIDSVFDLKSQRELLN